MGERVERKKIKGKTRFLLQKQFVTMINKGTRASLLTVQQFNTNIQVYFLEIASICPM